MIESERPGPLVVRARLGGRRAALVGAEHEDRVRAREREAGAAERALGRVGDLALLDLRADEEQHDGERDPADEREREPLARRARRDRAPWQPAPRSAARGAPALARAPLAQRPSVGVAVAAAPSSDGRARYFVYLGGSSGRSGRSCSGVWWQRHARRLRDRRRPGWHEAPGGRGRRGPRRPSPRPAARARGADEPSAARHGRRRRRGGCATRPTAPVVGGRLRDPVADRPPARRRGVARCTCRCADVPFRDVMAERLGLPVVVDNDANAAMLAEWRAGAARGRARRGAADARHRDRRRRSSSTARLVRGADRRGRRARAHGRRRRRPAVPVRRTAGASRRCVSGTALGREARGSRAATPDSRARPARSRRAARSPGRSCTELAHDGDRAARDVVGADRHAARRRDREPREHASTRRSSSSAAASIAAGELLLEPARAVVRERALSPSRDVVRDRRRRASARSRGCSARRCSRSTGSGAASRRRAA